MVALGHNELILKKSHFVFQKSTRCHWRWKPTCLVCVKCYFVIWYNEFLTSAKWSTSCRQHIKMQFLVWTLNIKFHGNMFQHDLLMIRQYCFRSWLGAWWHHQGPVSISDKTSYFKISWSLEAVRFVFRIVQSLWNLAGTSAALLPKYLSNFKAILKFKLRISRLRDFTRSCDKTSYRILKRGPGDTWNNIGNS